MVNSTLKGSFYSETMKNLCKFNVKKVHGMFFSGGGALFGIVLRPSCVTSGAALGGKGSAV